MLFNTFEFGIFFFIIFILYWFICNKSLRVQNILLLVASYYFYGCWDWRFLFLLAFSTFVGYYGGIKIYESQNEKGRKLWLWISVLVSVGFLAYFKYANFFIESFADLLRLIGLTPHISTLHIILPVGISFYTFHNLSYIIDIYYKKIKPTYNAVDYGVF
ncbi:MAG TPA: membrane-bound O-acyltransferase family protein, partial [Dysgonomonas sp.]|nr:membrane-bound O-acyltransferase family protein [Dysgonomonas sp.]